MKTTNLRNKPVDKRRLNAEDRAQYQGREKAKTIAQARLKRGQLAWENKVPVGKREQSWHVVDSCAVPKERKEKAPLGA